MKPIDWPRLLPLLLILSGCAGDPGSSRDTALPPVSGRLEGGLRVLTFDSVATGQSFTIYRGDYVRPELEGEGRFTIEIAALDVVQEFPATGDDSPYFKVPDVGRFDFRIGDATGTIEAIDYRASGYREVTSAEATTLIANVDPLVLDVRTPLEFRRGHLPNAELVPVQTFRRQVATLQRRVDRDRPVLVYCATGNRSTVAAKMLIDAGFTRVVNLRRGIAEWARDGRPIVR